MTGRHDVRAPATQCMRTSRPRRRCPGGRRSPRRPSARPACCTRRTACPGRPPPRHDRREPEGRRRQDDQRGEPRGRARDARAQGARHRPRPAGQRQHRARRRPPVRRAVDLRGAARRGVADRRRCGQRPVAQPLLRAGDHRPGRRGDRAGLDGGPGVPAQGGAAERRAGRAEPGLRVHRLPAVARPADRQRDGRRRGGADPDPVRVLRAGGSLASCCATSSWCRTT